VPKVRSTAADIPHAASLLEVWATEVVDLGAKSNGKTVYLLHAFGVRSPQDVADANEKAAQRSSASCLLVVSQDRQRLLLP
jgi:hypothetical protein